MRAILLLVSWISWVSWVLIGLLLASCSSAPKPPTVDESNRRPANSAMTIELQACKSDLHNSQIAARETQRTAAFNAASEDRMAALQQAISVVQARLAAQLAGAESAEAAEGNRVFTVHFEFGSTRVVMRAELRAALLDQARAAPLIAVRGRTDGVVESAAETHIASARAAAVRDYLIGLGVEPARIRVSHQATGDHIAENQTATGRARNRRVEIELYRALPVRSASSASSDLSDL
jgi:outer membrane protein OmpA-like peptidoglycan-associated protein